MLQIGEGSWAKLSALGVALLLTVLVGAAIAGRPAPVRPTPTLVVVVPAIAEAPPTPLPPTAEAPPAPTPSPDHHNNIRGDDGIFGLPGYPWRGTKAAQEPPRYVFRHQTRAPGGMVTR